MFEKFTKAARDTVTTAMAEATATHSPDVGPRHLLLGILTAGATPAREVLEGVGLDAAAVRADIRRDIELGESDAEALRSIGIDLDAVRANLGEPLEPSHTGRAKRPSFGRDAKKALELSLREAVLRKDRAITAEHLLLGILRGGEARTARLIAEHISARELRDALIGSMGNAA
ncbi:Clp protease N-terminal domain-containing protein [Tomitella biformata]|uniref:Clp protease N-terminal domain-containing protein n=1 Tax=Tomitella biformata TaxID=630403 RepID=UPI0004662DDD|nr:Clp protease N-terminal domain-containing protein [Tomitella biformata]